MMIHKLMSGLLVFWSVYTMTPTLWCMVFNCVAASNCYITLAATFRRHEMEKCCAYIWGTHSRRRKWQFIPLVFSTSDGIGKATTITYENLANLLVRSTVPIFCAYGLTPLVFWGSPCCNLASGIHILYQNVLVCLQQLTLQLLRGTCH